MIKVRLKRIKHGAYFHSYSLDNHFVNGSVPKMPKKGEHVTFCFNEFGTFNEGWLTTTRVVSVTCGKKLIIFNTRNSRYHMKKGWVK